MASERRSLEEIARALLDGQAWDAEQAGTDDREAALLRELRVVARIADVHRAVAERPDPPSPGTTWSHLKVLERLGQGGFGVVYRAWDSRLDREVALKLLPDDHTAGADELIEEGRLLARVRHPNVATIYGAERQAGFIGLWMELVPGKTLEDQVREAGALSVDEALDVACQLLEALVAVHAAGVIHRDVKTGNVMREAGGRVVLTDFGEGSDGSGEDQRYGTPRYLAPEVLAGGPATVRSDVYSAGVVLFRLLTARFPVAGESLQALRDAHAEHARSADRSAVGLPPVLRRLLSRALAPNPGSRYASASEMLAAIRAVRAARLRRWRATRTAAGVLLAVALVAASVLWFGPGASDWLTHGKRGQTRTQPAIETGAHKLVWPATIGVYGNGFTRDGSGLAFVDEDGNLAFASFRASSTERLLQVGPSQSVETCVASPDGGRVAFEWFAGTKYELRVIDRATRAQRVLVSDARVRDPAPIEWSDDGEAILAMLGREDGSRELALVPAAGGRLTPLRRFDADVPLRASLSPDGAFVAYDLPGQRGGTTVRRIFAMRTTTKEEWPLVEEPGNAAYPLWSGDGGAILFLSDRSGSVDAWRLAVRDGTATGDPVLAARNLGRARPLALTRDGRYYYALANGSTDVYTLGVASPGSLLNEKPQLVASRFSGSNLSPSFAPDGRTLAFLYLPEAPVGATPRIVLHDRLTGVERELSAGIAPALASPAWSPDGRSLLVRGTGRKQQLGFFVVDVASEKASPALAIPTTGASDFGRAAWLSTHEIVYAHARGIVVRDLRSGAERLLTAITGSFSVSPDGRLVAVASAPHASRPAVLVVVSVNGAAPTRELVRAEPGTGLAVQGWGARGESILFTRFPTARREADALWRVGVSGGPAERVPVDIPSNTFVNPVAVTRAGDALAYTRGMLTRDLWVMEGFLPASDNP